MTVWHQFLISAETLASHQTLKRSLPDRHRSTVPKRFCLALQRPPTFILSVYPFPGNCFLSPSHSLLGICFLSPSTQMMARVLWKRVITSQSSLSNAMPFLAFEFTVKYHIAFPNFCTQISTPSATPPDKGLATEFFISNCGLTPEEIAKAFRYSKGVLRANSTQNFEEVLELLKGYGLTTHAQIRWVVINNPILFSLKAKSNTQSKLALLRAFMKEENIAKVFVSNASVFDFREDTLKSRISLLQKLYGEGQALSHLIATQPRLLTVSEEKVLESFKLAENLGCHKGSKMFACLLRKILGQGKEKLEQRLQCLNNCFSEKQVSEILRRWPLILGYSEENLKHHVDFLVNSVGIPLDILVKYPKLFGYSLEKTLFPRYRVMEALKSSQGLKTDKIYPGIFCLTEKRFLEIYVDKNPDSSILRDIYHSGKVDC